MSNRPYEAVVFDLDGTLVDSSADITDAMNRAFADQGLGTVEVAQVAAALGGGPRALVGQCLAAVDISHPPQTLVDDVLASYSGHYRAHPADQTVLLDTAARVVPELARNGVLIGVCTNKRTALALTVLDAVGIGDAVGAVIGSDATDYPKPDRRHLTETVSALHADAHSVLYVGDTTIDQLTARRAGIPYAHVAWGHTQVSADHHLVSFDDLLTLAHTERKAI